MTGGESPLPPTGSIEVVKPRKAAKLVEGIAADAENPAVRTEPLLIALDVDGTKVGMLVAADQEGGEVQQLTGQGFSTIPSGREQGALDADELEQLVTDEVGGSALFASRFRECAARALLLPHVGMWTVLVLHVLLSLSLALLFTPLFTAGLGSLPHSLHAHGSALLGSSQQVFGAAGTATSSAASAARLPRVQEPVAVTPASSAAPPEPGRARRSAAARSSRLPTRSGSTRDSSLLSGPVGPQHHDGHDDQAASGRR